MSNPITMVPADRLHPHPDNVRSTLGDLRALVNSIEAQGILEPLLVRPNGDGYEIVAGHRRFAAGAEADLTEFPVIIRELDDQETVAIMLVENLQREDIDPLDEARGYFRLVEFGWTQKKLSEAVGVSTNIIRERMRLLTIPEQWARDAVENGKLGELGEVSKLVEHEEFDEEAALKQFEGIPHAASLERWLEGRVFYRQKQAIIESLPEDEPLIRKESSGAYGGRYRLPKNHVFIEHEDLSYDEDGINVDLETVRENGHLGWYVDVRGYGEKRHVAKLAVVTDRGYYTRKSSPAEPEERPVGWEKEVAARDEQRAERERRKQMEVIRRQRVIDAVSGATKTQLLDVLLDRVLNDMRSRAVQATAELMGVMVVDDEGRYVGHETEAAVREMSQVKQTEFITACYLIEDSSSEAERALLDEHAPFEDVTEVPE